MFQQLIEAAVERAIDRRVVRPDRKLTLDGYHPLPEIMGTLYEWLLIPFRQARILVEVRYPRSTQLPAVDKLSALAGRGDRPLTRKEMIDVMNIQEDCCKAVLNRPTFEELSKAILGKDRVLQDVNHRLAELRAMTDTVKGDAARWELREEIDRAELFCGYILPDDTMLALTTIALGADISDIRALTKESLITAYHKARLYGGQPSEFVPGIFTDGDRANIDDYATILGGEDETQRRRRAPRRTAS